MSTRARDMNCMELAMRCVLLVKARAAVGNAICLFDLVEVICDRYSVSRATSYRYARLSADVLGLDMSPNEARKARRSQRRGGGKMSGIHYA